MAKRSYCVLVFVLLLASQVRADRADSLRRVIASPVHDSARVEVLLVLGEEVFFTVPDSGLALWKKGLEIVRAQESENVPRIFRELEAALINNIAYYFNDRGNVEKAIEYYEQSLQLREGMGDKRGIAESKNNLAGIYASQGDTALALTLYQESSKLYDAVGDKGGTAYALINSGNLFRKQQRYAEALRCYQQSEAILRSTSDTIGWSFACQGLARVHFEQGRYEDAARHNLQCMTLRKKVDDRRGLSLTYALHSELFLKSMKTDSALHYGLLAQELARSLGFPDGLRASAEALWKAYEQSGDFQKALENHRLAVEMRDSLANEQTRKLAVRRQLKSEYEREKVALQKEQEKKDAVSRITIISVSGVLLLVLLFAALLFNRFRLINRQKRIIETQNSEILDSIHYAKRIQRALLASDSLLKRRLPEFFILYKPKDIVSGDFYWAGEVASGDEKLFLLCVADCTGHGVPGAFMSLLNISLLNETVLEKKITQPHLIFGNVRQSLLQAFSADEGKEEGRDGMDAVLCAFSEKNKRMEFACANNPVWLLRRGELLEFAPDKMPVGKHEGAQGPFTLQTVELQKEDILYLFTDGYADQFGGPKGKKFKYAQLKKVLLENAQRSLAEQKKALDETIEAWRGKLEQVDDILIVGIKIS